MQSGWRTVLDLDFKNNCWPAGALTENVGALTDITHANGGDNQYHLYVRSAANMSWTVTANTGIVVDFNSTTGKNRLAIKVPYFQQLTNFEAQPKWPKIRVSASFSGLSVDHSSDYIGVAVGGYYVNNANPKNPCVQAIYDVSSTGGPTFKYHAMSTKGSWGSTGSGLNISGAVNSDNSEDNGVIVIEDAGQGLWAARGHDGDVNIKTGNTPDTYRASTSGSGFIAHTGDKMFYRADAGGNDDYDGPYAMLWTNAGNTGGNQAVTWERLVVEMYI